MIGDESEKIFTSFFEDLSKKLGRKGNMFSVYSCDILFLCPVIEITFICIFRSRFMID